MTPSPQYDVAIIGGGPAGSTAAKFLARAGFTVCVIERREFPRETLCGEFLSKEVMDVVADLGLRAEFLALQPNPIETFRLSLGPGRVFSSALGFEGFGLKRGRFDQLLLEGACRAGASLLQPATARRIARDGNIHAIAVATPAGERSITASWLIGAHGKRGLADPEIPVRPGGARSPFNGLKFHVPRDRFRAFPEHEIQIYAGRGIYCGLNAVNDGDVTLCFLERRAKDDPPPRARFAELVASHPGLQEMAGPDARSLLMDLPVYGVSGIDFGRRPLVRDGVLMIGDAARVIAPVAGDGIAVAMESARLLSEVLIEGRKEGRSPSAVGRQYQREWNRLLRRRMVIARAAQSLLLTREGARFAAAALRLFPPLQLWAIRSTRA